MAENELRQAQLDEMADLLDLAAKSGYARYSSLFLLAELVREFNPVQVLELGTYHGCSTIFIAKALQPGAKLLSIDSYNMSKQLDVSNRLLEWGLHDKVSLQAGDTRNAARYMRGLTDMVFFDACHTDEGVIAEFNGIKDMLAPGAALIFDDALCILTALAEIGINNAAMRAYSVGFGLCVVVLP